MQKTGHRVSRKLGSGFPFTHSAPQRSWQTCSIRPIVWAHAVRPTNAAHRQDEMFHSQQIIRTNGNGGQRVGGDVSKGVQWIILWVGKRIGRNGEVQRKRLANGAADAQEKGGNQSKERRHSKERKERQPREGKKQKESYRLLNPEV